MCCYLTQHNTKQSKTTKQNKWHKNKCKKMCKMAQKQKMCKMAQNKDVQNGTKTSAKDVQNGTTNAAPA